MSEQSAETGTPGKWIKTNQGMAVCLTALVGALLAYLLSSEWVYEKLRDGFHLGLFTVISAITMVICSLAMIVDRQRNDTDKEMSSQTWQDWIVVLVVCVLSFFYFKLAWNFDFLIVSPFFLCGAMYMFGVRPLRSAITTSLIMTVAIYIVFRLIGIRLPSMIIGF